MIAACFLLALCSLWSYGRAQDPGEYVCQASRVCRNPATQLPLRALLRPNAAIRAEPDEKAAVKSTGSALQPWFVYQRRDVDYSDAANPKGWYQVHDSATVPQGTEPTGWVHARDLFEWKNAIVVSYSPWGSGSDRRGRVMMFNDRKQVESLLFGQDGAAHAKEILADIDKGTEDLVPKYGVVMAEPRGGFLDINQSFYLLPVLDFVPIDGLTREARYLQVAAAVPQEAGDTGRAGSGGSTLANPEEVKRVSGTSGINQGNSRATQGGTRNLKFDIKFAIDMTGSMQPFIDGTRHAVTQLTNEFARVGEDTVMFGLVGYTDIAEQCIDGCPFVIKHNFTPDALVSRERLVELLKDPLTNANGGGDTPEDVFDGVMEAAAGPWREDALHFIIQIGDASSNLPGTKGAVLTEEAVRSKLDADNINLISMHIRDVSPRVPPDVPGDIVIAERQFRVLARNTPNTVSYFTTELDPYRPDQENANRFEALAKEVAGNLTAELERARKGDVSYVAEPGHEPAALPAEKGSPEEAGNIAKQAAQAAIIEYLGRGGERPRDLVAWVTDVDLTDSSRDALDVRVLVQRSELEELINAIDGLLSGAKRGEATEQTFFSALQTVVTGATLDRMQGMETKEGAIRSASAIIDLMPSWLRSLPYHSALQKMTFDDYDRMNPNERANFQRDLESKLALYKDFQTDQGIWHALSPRQSDLQHVYAMKLTDLP
jgi:hypothetical protein